MPEKISLREAERKIYRTMNSDGLWDVFLGCFFLMFVIAPFLSVRMGDFWSSAIFLPFYGLVYLAIHLVRQRVVRPRMGTVEYGQARKARLTNFTVVMLFVNIAAFVLGLVAFRNFETLSGQMINIVFGTILLLGFSLAAFFLEFKRLYVYGLLTSLAPLAGEWLYSRYGVPHHGLPITFGIAAGIMIVVGLTAFVRLVRNNPPLADETPIGNA